MLHPCRYTRLEMVGLLIPAVSGYTIEQRKPDTQQGTNPSRDLQTAFVREAASPAHRTPFAWLADRPDQSTGTACRAPSAGRRLRGRQTARIRVRARHAVPHQPDAVCVVGEPLGSEYGHGMPCPMTQHRCNGTMPVPRDAMQQLLKRCLPVTRRAAQDLMPHPPPRPPPHSGTRG
jgi:hypothetical protein